MPANKLTARQAETRKPGRYGDGAGLWLVVSDTGARKWVFRFSFGGRVTETGLGATGLADARLKAAEARRLVKEGVNPILAKREVQEQSEIRTFGQVADDMLASKEVQWRNEKHRAQWRMTLSTYAASLRDMDVSKIETQHVVAVLKPVWLKVPETASRLRGRIQAVLDAARAQGFIDENRANPARWRGHLEKLLPAPKKLTRGHHAAISFGDLPAFYAGLGELESVAASALRFTILTAARTSEVREATWAEIDFDAALWVVPASRMKGGREHRAPLSPAALGILKKQYTNRIGDYVFPGHKLGKAMSIMAMTMLLRRLKADFTVHGMRSAFRDWAGDTTEHARETVEGALAHVFGDATERAYRRSDALEKRRRLMDDWARFCEGQ